MNFVGGCEYLSFFQVAIQCLYLSFLSLMILICLFFIGKECKQKVSEIVEQLEEEAKREEEAKEARKRPAPPPPPPPPVKAPPTEDPKEEPPKPLHRDREDSEKEYNHLRWRT